MFQFHIETIKIIYLYKFPQVVEVFPVLHFFHWRSMEILSTLPTILG